MEAGARGGEGKTGRERALDENLPERGRQGTALCLSGGGYRAALFHLGVLRRLDELGTLTRVDTVSSVSGGSILSAYVADRLGDWPRSGRLPGFADRVAPGFRGFTKKNIRTAWALRRALPWNLGDSTVAVDTLQRRYEKDVIGRRLADLPARPRFIFCATDLTFGTNWVAERKRVGSYMPGYVAPPPDWPAARAVAASSCFPPVFEPQPVGLEPSRYRRGMLAADHPERDELIRELRLTDGGVYDNMALEPVWKDHAVLLVSDGGATFDVRSHASMLRPLKALGRYMGVQGRQASAVRKRWLLSMFLDEEMRGVYLGIGSATESFERGARGYSRELVRDVIAEVRTDLDYFSDAEAAVLQNHGYLLADAAMRVYGGDWTDDDAPAAQIPFPEWMDEDAVRRALHRSHQRALPFGRWRAVEGARDALARLWRRGQSR